MNIYEHAMIAAINAARASRGVHALRHDTRLSSAAYDHAVDLSRHPGMLHEGSDGSTILERILRAGYNASWHYECVGWGFNGDIPPMVQWWLDSPAHAAILYDSNVTDIGAGYVVAPGTVWGYYWCVDFAAGDSRVEPPPPAPPRPYTSHAPVVVGGTVAAGVDLLRFKLADGDCWRVVRHPSGAQEDVQDMELGGGLFVRRKGNNGEWHRYDDRYFYLVHDTSPAPGAEGIERVYTLYRDGMPGAPKSRRFQALGEEWHEEGLHRVQFRARHGCGLLSENSGMAQNHSVIVRHERGYTFNRYGQQLTFDEVIWERTGVEMQIYGRKDGRSCGWIGWDAPWGSSEPVEIHWNRGRLRDEPDRCCGW